MQTRKRYEHSAYWRAAHDSGNGGKGNGGKRRNAPSYTGMYLGLHMHCSAHTYCFDYDFNPLMFGLCIAMDIGVAVKHDIAMIGNERVALV